MCLHGGDVGILWFFCVSAVWLSHRWFIISYVSVSLLLGFQEMRFANNSSHLEQLGFPCYGFPIWSLIAIIRYVEDFLAVSRVFVLLVPCSSFSKCMSQTNQYAQ